MNLHQWTEAMIAFRQNTSSHFSVCRPYFIPISGICQQQSQTIYNLELLTADVIVHDYLFIVIVVPYQHITWFYVWFDVLLNLFDCDTMTSKMSFAIFYTRYIIAYINGTSLYLQAIWILVSQSFTKIIVYYNITYNILKYTEIFFIIYFRANVSVIFVCTCNTPLRCCY